MTRISLVATTAVLLALVGLAVAQHCIKDDFSGTSNPNGVWSYGSRVSPNFAGSMTSPDPFVIFTQQGFGGWTAGGTYPMVNPQSPHITSAPNTGVEAVIRFTSTVAATATITGSARDFWTQESNKNVVIRHGNAADTTAPVAIVGPTDISTLPSRTLTIPATVVTLAAGDTIEFSSGGGLDYNRIIWEMCIDSVPTTLDPAVTAFCDDIATQCTQMDAECTTIRNGGQTNVADDCDASVSACNDVYADCVEKVSNCPLV